MLNFLFVNFRNVFNDIFLGGSTSKVREFWQGVIARKDPRLRFHPMCQRANWMDRAIPIAIHGDAVPCIAVGRSGTRSFEAYSWQSILGVGSTAKLKQFICGVFEACIAKPTEHEGKDTMNEVWTVILWSLLAAYEGLWPIANHLKRAYSKLTSQGLLANTPLAGTSATDTFFLIIWSIKGDWDHFIKRFGTRSYSSNRICDWCECDRSSEDIHMWPTNMRKNAKWKSNLISAEAWRALYGDKLHLLFVIFHFLSNANIDPDELHVFHIGSTMYFLGSVLWLLVYRLMPSNPVKNMEMLWGLIQEYYSEHSVSTQYSNLSLSSFCNPDKPRAKHPKLKGRGAEVKHLVKPLWVIWNKYRRAGNEEDMLFK